MKMSNMLKILGSAVLLAGLTPYRVSTDEETGKKKVRALFWEAVHTPKTDDMADLDDELEVEKEKNLSIRLGFFSPLDHSDDEPHLFADDLTVDYTQEDEAGAAEEAVEEEAAEDAPAAEPEAETKEEAEAPGED